MQKALLKTLFLVAVFFVLFHVSAFAAENAVQPTEQTSVEKATAVPASNSGFTHAERSAEQSTLTAPAPPAASSEKATATTKDTTAEANTTDNNTVANAQETSRTVNTVHSQQENIAESKHSSEVSFSKAAVQPSVNATSASATEQPRTEQLSAPGSQSAVDSISASEPPVQTQQSAQHAKILHTNDMHGRILGEEGRVIGMSKLKSIKEEEQPDLMLDSGDAFQGLPISNNTKGTDMAKAMNSVGYDAMAVGNHEFDFGLDQAAKYKDQLHFPILSANTYKDNKLLFDPYTIVKKNGIRYGIVGVTTPETAVKTHPDNIKGVTFTEPIPAVQNALSQIDHQADVFVVLAHLGVDNTTKAAWRGDTLANTLAQDARFKGKEIIVLDGHSHTVIQNGRINQNTLLAQTGTALENIGKVEFDYLNGTVSNVRDSLINVKDTAEVKPDAELQKLMDEAKAKFDNQVSEVVIPNNPVQFAGERDDVRTRETNLGNAITDAMEAYGEDGFSHSPDFAVTNGGGIRASIDKGKNVTLGDVITVLPFGNTISQIQVKGANVQKMFEHSLSAPVQDGKLGANGGFLHISKSIRVYYDIHKDPGSRVLKIEVLNKKTHKFEALDPERTYYMTTNDFTASGGDGYDMLGGPREEGVSLDKVFADYLKHADLAQYAANDATRIINGKPPVAEDNHSTERNNEHVDNADVENNKKDETPAASTAGKVIAGNFTDSDNSSAAGTLGSADNGNLDTTHSPDGNIITEVDSARAAGYQVNDVTVHAALNHKHTTTNNVVALSSSHHKNSELPASGQSETRNSPVIPATLILLGIGILYSKRKQDEAA